MSDLRGIGGSQGNLFGMGNDDVPLRESHAMALSARLASMSAADSQDMLLTGFLVEDAERSSLPKVHASKQSAVMVACDAEADNSTLHAVHGSQGDLFGMGQ